MTCPNCASTAWENVDQHRIKASGMAVCTECGFVSYPEKWKTPEEIKAHYRTSYRNPPTHANLFACERKNFFHQKFLHDLFQDWKARGIESPRILEIGAAFGFTLHWVRTHFPKAELHGTELTPSFRRTAFHEFGIRLDEEIDESKKYDLILTYKVIEHQLDPHLELERYARLLSPEGRLYVSVPTWFNSLNNFGMGGFDLEYYYDPNHINVWSREIFENILTRAGFEITKGDQAMYSSTYLAKPNPEMRKTPVFKRAAHLVKSDLENIKKAFLLCHDNHFNEAIALWPNYPQAHVSRAEFNRKLLTEKGWDWFEETFIDPALEACPESSDPVIAATDFAMRADKWKDATAYAEMALAMRPENPTSLNHLANIMREMALRASAPQEKLHYFVQAREVARHLRAVSTQHFREATDLIFFFNSKIPFPGEDAPKVQAPAPNFAPVLNMVPKIISGNEARPNP